MEAGDLAGSEEPDELVRVLAGAVELDRQIRLETLKRGEEPRHARCIEGLLREARPAGKGMEPVDEIPEPTHERLGLRQPHEVNSCVRASLPERPQGRHGAQPVTEARKRSENDDGGCVGKRTW